MDKNNNNNNNEIIIKKALVRKERLEVRSSLKERKYIYHFMFRKTFILSIMNGDLLLYE